MQKKFVAMVLSAAFMLATAQPSLAITQPQESIRSSFDTFTHMPAGSRVLPPNGFTMFCARTPSACTLHTGRTIITRSNAITFALLNHVNTRVNKTIRPRADRRVDDWRADVTVGDCEDFALTKRASLLRMGWSSKDLLITTARTSDGQKHAVLIVRTAQGDYVLDNLTSKLKRWDQVGYKWLKQQSATNPRHWVKVASIS